MTNFVSDKPLQRKPIEFERGLGQPELERVSEDFEALEQMFTYHEAFCAYVLHHMG